MTEQSEDTLYHTRRDCTAKKDCKIGMCGSPYNTELVWLWRTCRIVKRRMRVLYRMTYARCDTHCDMRIVPRINMLNQSGNICFTPLQCEMVVVWNGGWMMSEIGSSDVWYPTSSQSEWGGYLFLGTTGTKEGPGLVPFWVFRGFVETAVGVIVLLGVSSPGQNNNDNHSSQWSRGLLRTSVMLSLLGTWMKWRCIMEAEASSRTQP